MFSFYQANTKQYKTEVGKDFKRLVFYLCDTDKFSAYEKSLQEPANTSEGPSDDDVIPLKRSFLPRVSN